MLFKKYNKLFFYLIFKQGIIMKILKIGKDEKQKKT